MSKDKATLQAFLANNNAPCPKSGTTFHLFGMVHCLLYKGTNDDNIYL